MLYLLCSSCKEAGDKTDVDITHTADGSITIAPAIITTTSKSRKLLQEYIDHEGLSSYR